MQTANLWVFAHFAINFLLVVYSPPIHKIFIQIVSQWGKRWPQRVWPFNVKLDKLDNVCLVHLILTSIKGIMWCYHPIHSQSLDIWTTGRCIKGQIQCGRANLIQCQSETMAFYLCTSIWFFFFREWNVEKLRYGLLDNRGKK